MKKARITVTSVDDGGKTFTEDVDVGTTSDGYGFYVLDLTNRVRIWVTWKKEEARQK